MSKLSKVSLGIVLVITVVSFILSYQNIAGLAADNGMTAFQAALFPFLIDASMLVFAVAFLERTLKDNGSKRAWGLTLMIGLYAMLSVAFNVWHSNFTPAGIVIAVVIPMTLFFTFETAMGQIRQHVKAHGQSLTTKARSLEETLAVITKERDALHTKAKRLETQLSKVKGGAEESKPVKASSGKRKVKIGETKQKVSQLALDNPDKTNTWIAQQLGVSRQAVGQHMRSLNGKVEKPA